MGRGFDESIPEQLLSRLKPGDIICVQNFDWWVSWLIMYLTQSSISHVATYLGNRTISDMTLEGVIKVPIDNLYKPEARFLPFILFIPENKRKEVEPIHDSLKDKVYYSKLLILKKGLQIIFGRDWSLYRFSFLIDIFLSCLLLDLLTYPLVTVHLSPVLFSLYVIILIINRILWLRKPTYVAYPERTIMGLFNTGHGIPLLDVHLSRLNSEQGKPDNGKL
jgi:hypothetical protein